MAGNAASPRCPELADIGVHLLQEHIMLFPKKKPAEQCVYSYASAAASVSEGKYEYQTKRLQFGGGTCPPLSYPLAMCRVGSNSVLIVSGRYVQILAIPTSEENTCPSWTTVSPLHRIRLPGETYASSDKDGNVLICGGNREVNCEVMLSNRRNIWVTTKLPANLVGGNIVSVDSSPDGKQIILFETRRGFIFEVNINSHSGPLVDFEMVFLWKGPRKKFGWMWLSETELLVAGGEEPTTAPSRRVSVLISGDANDDSNMWREKMLPELNVPRIKPLVLKSSKGNLCVAGGTDGKDCFLESVEWFDEAEGKWHMKYENWLREFSSSFCVALNR